jgi:hypothetical protein
VASRDSVPASPSDGFAAESAPHPVDEHAQR